MKDSFYSAFEKKYRGSRELIGKRLEAYIPVITPLLTVYPEANAFDLGCGRGEWLEMVSNLGFDARGVDLDDGMLSYCNQSNLKAEKADAIASLKMLPDNSLALISSFHLVEHIGFNNVRILVEEAIRVLKPGGILILETPNAENIQVGTHTFHLDPTHDKPIPHQLLEFLAEYVGFNRTKVMRLQEPEHINVPNLEVTLSDVLLSVSPDYSIVAQKNADETILNQFDAEFAVNHGVSLIELAKAYDEIEQIKESSHENNLQNIKDDITQLKTHAKKIESFINIETFENKLCYLGEEKVRLEFENAQFKKEIEQLKLALAKVTNDYHIIGTAHHHLVFSRSWRITKPYRFVGRQLKYLFKQGPSIRFRQIIKRVLVSMNHRLSRYPVLRAKLVSCVRKARLEILVRRIYSKMQNVSNVNLIDELLVHQDLKNQLDDPDLIPPIVKEIFSKLK